MLAEFHFLRPWWLLALLPLLLLLIWQARHHLSASAWKTVVDPQLLAWLSGQSDTQSKRGRWLTVVLGISGLLATVALAGPVWERQPQPVVRATQARVIVLDLSRSMLATDQKPSRLEQARFKLEDILTRSREGQTGLVAYAGEAFVISPLTNDSRTIQALLPALAPDIMPVQGARADLALQKAADLLNQAGVVNGEILLITDGINLERTQAVVESLRRNGITTSVLAIGTEQGAPIPLPEGGFMQDQQGDIVIPQLQPQELQALARSGGGRYSLLSVDARDVDYLIPEQSPAATEERERSDEQVESGSELWKEQGPWLVLLLLPLAALSFRRGWLFCWCLIIPGLMLHSGSIQAADETQVQTQAIGNTSNWWKTPAQQARQALDSGEHEFAGQLVEQLDNQPLLAGEAYYRNGDYAAAAEAFAKAGNAQGSYNQGNALAQAGQIEEAIAAYEQALQQDPNLQDAEHNLDVLKNLQQQQQQQNQDGDQQQDQQQQDGEQQEEEQQQGEQDEQSQQEGEQQDGQQQEQQQGEQSDEQQQSADEQQEDEQEESEQEQEGEAEEQQDAEQGEQEVQQQPVDISELDEEQQRALEQWLRRIPDDPGALLRNKFRYQYQRQQRQQTDDSDEDDW